MVCIYIYNYRKVACFYFPPNYRCFGNLFRFNFSARKILAEDRVPTLILYSSVIYCYHIMSAYRSWLRLALAFALLAVVYGAPIWEELFGFPPRQHYQRNTQPTPRAHRAGGKEKFKATCWVISADNYAFPGQSPYPSAPLCPY